MSTLAMRKICATPGQSSCFLRSIGLHLLHTFLLELCDQSSQPDDLLVGFHLHHGTLLGALSRLLRRFCMEGLQIAQPIGQLLLQLNLGFLGFSDVLLCPGHLFFHSCDVLEAQVEALSNRTHLSLTLRPFQCNLSRFGLGVVLAQKFQRSLESFHTCGRFCHSVFKASSRADLALDCSCPKACNAASRRPTFDWAFCGVFCGARGTATGSPCPGPWARGHWTEGGRPLMTSCQPLGVAIPSPARHELCGLPGQQKKESHNQTKPTLPLEQRELEPKAAYPFMLELHRFFTHQ